MVPCVNIKISVTRFITLRFLTLTVAVVILFYYVAHGIIADQMVTKMKNRGNLCQEAPMLLIFL